MDRESNGVLSMVTWIFTKQKYSHARVKFFITQNNNLVIIYGKLGRKTKLLNQSEIWDKFIDYARYKMCSNYKKIENGRYIMYLFQTESKQKCNAIIDSLSNSIGYELYDLTDEKIKDFNKDIQKLVAF